MADTENQIGFDQLGLGSVLKHNQMAVPPNQREYSWTDREVTTLLQDIAKSISSGDPSYFLGTIVTIPRAHGVLEVVDGQQRLATTALLLAAIRDYSKSINEPVIAESLENEFLTGIDRAKRERIPKLRLNLDDNDFFKKVITDGGSIPDCTRQSHTRIKEASSLSKKQVSKIVSGLDKKDHGDLMNQWIHFIEKKALIVLLKVPNDSDAYKMFETLNDRGLRTSQSDLVKNYLFGRSGDRLPEVQQKWALMRGALESLDDEEITINYLRHALIVIHRFVREADVYEAVQELARNEQTSVTFISNLESLSNAYVAIHNPEHEKWNSYTDSVRNAIEVLNLLDIKPLRPLMLAVASKFSNAEAAKSFKFFITLGIRLFIAGSTRSGSTEQQLAGAAHRIYIEEITNTAEVIESLKGITPSDAQFKSAFETATVSSAKLARYYLRSLEMAAKAEQNPWLIPNNDRQVINLEHVLPQKPEDNWPNFDDDYARLYYRRIGNLALLIAKSNSDLRSSDFQTKKAVYAESPYVLTQQLSELDDWTPAEVANRQKLLAEYALKAWAL